VITVADGDWLTDGLDERDGLDDGDWLVLGLAVGLAVGIAKEATLMSNTGTFVASPILYVFRVMPW
jgi:hypothetical protein